MALSLEHTTTTTTTTTTILYPFNTVNMDTITPSHTSFMNTHQPIPDAFAATKKPSPAHITTSLIPESFASRRRSRSASPPLRGRPHVVIPSSAWTPKARRSSMSPPSPPFQRHRNPLLTSSTSLLTSLLLHRNHEPSSSVQQEASSLDDDDQDGAIWFGGKAGSSTLVTSPVERETSIDTLQERGRIMQSFRGRPKRHQHETLSKDLDSTSIITHSHPINVPCTCGVQASKLSSSSPPQQRSASYSPSSSKSSISPPPLPPSASSPSSPTLTPSSSRSSEDPSSAVLIRSLSTAKLCQHGRPMCQVVGIVNLTHHLPSDCTDSLTAAEIKQRRRSSKSRSTSSSRRRASWHAGMDERGRDSTGCTAVATIMTSTAHLYASETECFDTIVAAPLSSLIAQPHTPSASVRCRSPLRFSFSVDEKMMMGQAPIAPWDDDDDDEDDDAFTLFSASPYTSITTDLGIDEPPRHHEDRDRTLSPRLSPRLSGSRRKSSGSVRRRKSSRTDRSPSREPRARVRRDCDRLIVEDEVTGKGVGMFCRSPEGMGEGRSRSPSPLMLPDTPFVPMPKVERVVVESPRTLSFDELPVVLQATPPERVFDRRATMVGDGCFETRGVQISITITDTEAIVEMPVVETPVEEVMAVGEVGGMKGWWDIFSGGWGWGLKG